jgi:hypothetical protein
MINIYKIIHSLIIQKKNFIRKNCLEIISFFSVLLPNDTQERTKNSLNNNKYIMMYGVL